MMFRSLSILALAALASGTAIVIEVSEADALSFLHESTSAEVGDISHSLEFHFYMGDLSVIRPFDKPCTPGPNAAFSVATLKAIRFTQSKLYPWIQSGSTALSSSTTRTAWSDRQLARRQQQDHRVA
ncbi:hypothetical protein BJ875DRAFT_521768 [Amylocarpus encephaloides]|uniref:Uncharacterized protein n=1 Tax=Amylocarpus encephaloides TaxID=45428 RepID=A0A9P7YQ19_9HELO|nr:hypothetical protein BJ875DRAFT_521768 [Amylocarpus encephaloides]